MGILAELAARPEGLLAAGPEGLLLLVGTLARLPVAPALPEGVPVGSQDMPAPALPVAVPEELMLAST